MDNGTTPPMITLTPITTPEKLDEYFRFRYQIYSESGMGGFLSSTDGIDKDEHDARARHFGWYVDGKLAACERMIPIENDRPYLCEGIGDKSVESAILDHIHQLIAHGHKPEESSRICLHPDRRSIGTVKAFVLALVAKAHSRKIDQGLFTVPKPHAAFYLRLGFGIIPGARAFEDRKAHGLMSCIAFSYEKVLEKNRLELEQLNAVHGAEQLQTN